MSGFHKSTCCREHASKGENLLRPGTAAKRGMDSCWRDGRRGPGDGDSIPFPLDRPSREPLSPRDSLDLIQQEEDLRTGLLRIELEKRRLQEREVRDGKSISRM